jgi:hypothetical protein
VTDDPAREHERHCARDPERSRRWRSGGHRGYDALVPEAYHLAEWDEADALRAWEPLAPAEALAEYQAARRAKGTAGRVASA